MRCIEIWFPAILPVTSLRLTLTWDVLKWISVIYIVFCFLRLTLTWDVLKSNRKLWPLWGYYKININMRCIEILLNLVLNL